MIKPEQLTKAQLNDLHNRFHSTIFDAASHLVFGLSYTIISEMYNNLCKNIIVSQKKRIHMTYVLQTDF